MKTVYDFNPIFPHQELRVGFIGTHSVGKTKQVHKLAKLLRIPTITEAVRHVLVAMGHGNIGDIPDVMLMQWKVLQMQLAQEAEGDTWLSDRTTLDNAAYALYYMHDKMGTGERRSYMERAQANVSRYTHLIYFPVMWGEIEDDGFRGTNRADRLAVDGVVQDLIGLWDLTSKVYTIRQDDWRDGEDARLIEILEHLNLWQAIREFQLTKKEALA